MVPASPPSIFLPLLPLNEQGTRIIPLAFDVGGLGGDLRCGDSRRSLPILGSLIQTSLSAQVRNLLLFGFGLLVLENVVGRERAVWIPHLSPPKVFRRKLISGTGLQVGYTTKIPTIMRDEWVWVGVVVGSEGSSPSQPFSPSSRMSGYCPIAETELF